MEKWVMTNYFSELDKSFARYKNLIGIGVMITILLGIGVIIMSTNQVREIAAECGFTDGDMKCVCTEEAWNTYQEALEIVELHGEKVGIYTESLNISNT